MKICKNCSYKNPDNAIFCRECGKNLVEQADIAPKDESVAIIENLTLFNKATLKSFFNGVKVIAIVSSILGVILFAFGLFDAINSSNYLFLVLSIILIVLSPAMFFQYNKITKDKRFSDSTYQTCKFYDDFIKIVSYEDDVENGYVNLSYDKINKVTKNDNFILIRVGSLVYLLNTEGFTIGNFELLKNLLNEKCGSKIVKLK